MTPNLVRFDDEQREDGKFLTGKLVTPDHVRQETGTYWGYSLRLAESLGKVRCPGLYYLSLITYSKDNHYYRYSQIYRMAGMSTISRLVPRNEVHRSMKLHT